MKNDKLKKSIEAILFISGNSVSVSDLASTLNAKKEEVKQAVQNLKESLSGHGIVITESNDTYQMATDPNISSAVKKYLQSKLREKFTEASAETLAIIAYKQPISRAEIESIRGVNSQYILKLLQQRGLIEKTSSSSDARVILYQITHEFLHHLGIESIEELPDFEKISENITPELETMENTNQEN